MNNFEKTITSIYREKGKIWLANLPKMVQEIAADWELIDLCPLKNLSYNYVLTGIRNGKPIVLKLSIDERSLHREVQSLNAFAGYGAVSVLDHKPGAVLLEKAEPGKPLKNFFPTGSQDAITIACTVARKLHEASLPQKHDFPQIASWLAALDQEWTIPHHILLKARLFKNELLKTTRHKPVLLHGDLHQDNILDNGKEWLIIDPKGVVGYSINEIWAFVEEPKVDLPFISEYFGYNFDDVVRWYYVHLVLAACWRVEDGLDPNSFLKLASQVESEMSLYT